MAKTSTLRGGGTLHLRARQGRILPARVRRPAPRRRRPRVLANRLHEHLARRRELPPRVKIGRAAQVQLASTSLAIRVRPASMRLVTQTRPALTRLAMRTRSTPARRSA
jgi:hypothetical protein